MKQVQTESTRRNEGMNVLVCSRNDTDINCQFAVAANGLNLAFLKYAEQLALQSQLEVGDLV
jgi:hypothetical protein